MWRAVQAANERRNRISFQLIQMMVASQVDLAQFRSNLLILHQGQPAQMLPKSSPLHQPCCR